MNIYRAPIFVFDFNHLFMASLSQDLSLLAKNCLFPLLGDEPLDLKAAILLIGGGIHIEEKKLILKFSKLIKNRLVIAVGSQLNIENSKLEQIELDSFLSVDFYIPSNSLLEGRLAESILDIYEKQKVL